MTADPRAALSTLVSALERHLEAAGSKRGENDPVVFAAYQDVAEAFDAYDDALLDAFDEVTPLEVYHEDSDDDEADDADEGAGGDELDEIDDDREAGATYQGLDDEDYDEDAPPAS
jgi:hypothetical protein